MITDEAILKMKVGSTYTLEDGRKILRVKDGYDIMEHHKLEPLPALEMKHIIPYLPFGLSIVYNGGVDTYEVVGVDLDDNEVIAVDSEGYRNRLRLDTIKLCLTNPQDLVEVEVKEGTLLNKLFLYDLDRKDFNKLEADIILEEVDFTKLPYHVLQKLLEEKIDIFGLEDKNLAIWD